MVTSWRRVCTPRPSHLTGRTPSLGCPLLNGYRERYGEQRLRCDGGRGYTARLVRRSVCDAIDFPPYAFQIADTDMMRPLPIAASLALALLPLALAAQEPAQASTTPASTTPASTAGNAANGKQLTFTCQGCHGVVGYKNVYPTYHVPKIGGQSQQYLLNALTEYKQGKRKHPTMQAQAESFSDQDIADIAAFLSTLK